MHDEEAMVSIVIPTFKRAERLENAISSCLNQSYKNLEIIVIDDNGLGSENQLKTKNNIDNIIERFNDQRIKYIPNARNMGGAIARNIGVDNSSGEYIAFLDDDDLLHPDSIKLRLEAIAGHDVDFCVSDMNIIDEHENYVECDSNSFRGYNLIDFILDGNFYTPMLLINKGVFLQVGGFTDSPRYQDYILMIKLLSRNFSLHHLNNRLFYHIRHADERISTTTSENVKRGRLRIIELQEKFIHLLNHKQKRKVRFNWYYNLAISSVIEGAKLDAIKYIMKMIVNMYSVSCVKKICIMSLRVIVARDFYDKIRSAFMRY